jgi:hypothetical protein
MTGYWPLMFWIAGVVFVAVLLLIAFDRLAGRGGDR